LQTDRQLLVLINRRLDNGFAAARRIRRGASNCYQDVTKACAEIARLLPVVETLSRQERARIASRLAELEGMIAFSGMQAAS
jgi:hypothetical protein